MNISKESFLTRDKELSEEIKSFRNKEGGNFIDGALNTEEYYNSNIKILWILKEAYGDVFSYPDFFKDEFEKFYNEIICGVPKFTWGTIAKVSHNIINGFTIINGEADQTNNKENVRDTLSKIAFVNVNKDSSYTGGRSENRNLIEALKHYDRLLLKQIEHLRPDVIICGNSFQFLKASFGNPQVIKKVNDIDYIDHYLVYNKFILDPYHPGYLAYGKIDETRYINDIVRTVRDCLPSNS